MVSPILTFLGGTALTLYLKSLTALTFWPVSRELIGAITWVALIVLVQVLINRPARYDRKALEATLKVLANRMAVPTEKKVRLSIWARSGRYPETRLEQITQYLRNYKPDADDPVGTGLGHTLLASQGVIGYSMLNKTTKVALVPEERYPGTDDIKKHHREEWIISESKASELGLYDRRAYLAAPILDEAEESVLGVIYCDSVAVDAFPPEIEEDLARVAPFFRQLLLIGGD